MKFDFIEKVNSNVLVIEEKEQLVISNWVYQTSISPKSSKEFVFEDKYKKSSARIFNTDNDDLYINGVNVAVTNALDVYSRIAKFFENKITDS